MLATNVVHHVYIASRLLFFIFAYRHSEKYTLENLRNTVTDIWFQWLSAQKQCGASVLQCIQLIVCISNICISFQIFNSNHTWSRIHSGTKDKLWIVHICRKIYWWKCFIDMCLSNHGTSFRKLYFNYSLQTNNCAYLCIFTKNIS